MNDKKKIALYLVVLVVTIIIGGITASYAFFRTSSTSVSTLDNVIGDIDCIDVSIEEQNRINLTNEYPISDTYALQNKVPVTVTVTNNCTANIEEVPYVLTLTSLKNATGFMDDRQVKINVKKTPYGGSESTLIDKQLLGVLPYINSGNVDTYLNNNLAIREDTSSYTTKTNYVIDTGSLDAGESTIYKINLWIDYYEGNPTNGNALGFFYNGSTQNKNFKGAISVVLNSSDYSTTTSTNSLPTGVVKYNGAVTELYTQYGNNAVNANKVYFFTSNDNNNVIFDDYCWKVIRTTETGGVKLLYNGEPSNGECVESSNSNDFSIGSTSFNIQISGPASAGYMYNKTTGTLNEILYAEDVNKTDSDAKQYIENWFQSTSNIDESKLEDIVYCGDRSLDSSQTNPDLNVTYDTTLGNVYFKNYNGKHLSLECEKETDSFSKSNNKAKLKYKIGLMTYPEAYLMGVTARGKFYRLISPNYFDTSNVNVYVVLAVDGSLPNNLYAAYVTYPIRPVISINSDVRAISGNGSTSSPWIAN